MMNRKNFLHHTGPAILLLLLFTCGAMAQEARVRGFVRDASTGETLPGVNIVIDSLSGTATDDRGYYELSASPGKISLTFKYIGYLNQQITLQLKPGETVARDILMQPRAIELNAAVVTASRYEQRLSDVTVSMEVLRADYIQQVNTQQLDETLRLLPGVDVIDGQANIRGGSGYSYGAGSRVMLLVDELPMLTGDINDVKWSYLPLELIDQVEVIKGASSALYGSSALNGVINLRTAEPTPEPGTSVEISSGLYGKPEREELAWWWDRNPFFGLARFSHLRKSGPFDITLGGSGLFNEGYREDNYERYGRFYAGVRYNPKNLESLSVGLKTSFQAQAFSDFLIWKDADSGAWQQNPTAITPTDGLRFNLDPFAVYFDEKDGRHSFKGRYFMVKNSFPEDPDKENGSDYFFGEYQYQKEFRHGLHLNAGVAGSYTVGNSNLYGDHHGSTLAIYTQLDKQFFDRLSLSLGLRWERYTLDQTDDEARPVLRTGVNYRLAEYSYLRASFGQGYRYPSMAEKYTSTSLGALKIFPNPLLEPETGWSAELGFKQGIRAGSWSGFIDIAGFWTQYQQMMEFTFGLYKPDSVPVGTIEHIGFKSLNVGDTRIAGVDLSLTGQGKAGPLRISLFGGYTYMDPVDLSADTISEKMLKYRYNHSAKADVSAVYRDYSAGFSLVYTSFIERIDEAFEETILGQEFFPGLKEYRQENDHGAVVVDLRLGWQVSASSRIGFFINNLFNVEYMGRPGDIRPPRSFSLQYLLDI